MPQSPLSQWLEEQTSQFRLEQEGISNQFSLLDAFKAEDAAVAAEDINNAIPDPTQFAGMPLNVAARQWEQNKARMYAQAKADIESDYSQQQQQLLQERGGNIDAFKQLISKVNTLEQTGLSKYLKDYKAVPKDDSLRSTTETIYDDEGKPAGGMQVFHALSSNDELEVRTKEIADFFGIAPQAVENQILAERAASASGMQALEDRQYKLQQRARTQRSNMLKDAMLLVEHPELVTSGAYPRDSKENMLAGIIREAGIRKEVAGAMETRQKEDKKFIKERLMDAIESGAGDIDPEHIDELATTAANQLASFRKAQKAAEVITGLPAGEKFFLGAGLKEATAMVRHAAADYEEPPPPSQPAEETGPPYRSLSDLIQTAEEKKKPEKKTGRAATIPEWKGFAELLGLKKRTGRVYGNYIPK